MALDGHITVCGPADVTSSHFRSESHDSEVLHQVSGVQGSTEFFVIRH